MAVVLDLVLAAQWELPADLGLIRERVDAPLEGGRVERAARPGAEVGAVQEDASVLVETGHQLAVLVGVDDRLLGAVVLPLGGREGLGDLLDTPCVLLVDQVGAITAAALHELGCGAGEHALAALAEDALPIARQEADVEDPGAFLVLVLEADPLTGVDGGSRHDKDDTWSTDARATWRGWLGVRP